MPKLILTLKLALIAIVAINLSGCLATAAVVGAAAAGTYYAKN